MLIYEKIDGDDYEIEDDGATRDRIYVRRMQNGTTYFVGSLWRTGQAEYRLKWASRPIVGIRTAIRELVTIDAAR
jgi:hypothetical protein